MPNTEQIKKAVVLTATVLVTLYVLRHLPVVGPLADAAITG